MKKRIYEIKMKNELKSIVENVLNRWSALRLAVEHGMSKDGIQTAIDFVNYVTESLIENPRLDEDNLMEILEDIMDQEFDTICDDNSIHEVARVLMKYFTMLKNNQLELIEAELSQLPPCELWIVPGGRVRFTKTQDDSSSDSDDDEEMMETSDFVESNDVAKPSTSGSTLQFEEEEMDPGWTIVKSHRKKK